MVNSACSCAGKWISELGSNTYEVVVNGVIEGAITTVTAAVSLPFRILGCCDNNEQLKDRLHQQFGNMTSGIAKSIVNIINPYAEMHKSASIGDEFLELFDRAINPFASSKYFFNRQVTTRLCYALKAPAAAAARAYDAVIGIAALAHAALCLGANTHANSDAISEAAGAGKIVGDLFECALGFLNPNTLH